MAKSNDPLMESLMQMAAAAAPLIRKARESGFFRERETVVDAEVVPPEAPKAPESPKDAAAPPPVNPNTGALQDIIVRQALRINELEADVAALKAAASEPATKNVRPKAKPPSKAKPRPAKA
jgi:hypothetical protein